MTFISWISLTIVLLINIPAIIPNNLKLLLIIITKFVTNISIPRDAQPPHKSKI